MIDGGKTVFSIGKRDFCLTEMMREACRQYADYKCTLDEFVDMYESVALAAIGITEEHLQEQLRNRSRGGDGCCGGATAYA